MKNKKSIIAWMAFNEKSPAIYMAPYSSIPCQYLVGKTKKSVNTFTKAVKVKITIL